MLTARTSGAFSTIDEDADEEDAEEAKEEEEEAAEA